MSAKKDRFALPAHDAQAPMTCWLQGVGDLPGAAEQYLLDKLQHNLDKERCACHAWALGRVDVNQCCASPSRLFGLHPQRILSL